MFCKHCGKEVDGNSKFCANCGGELEKNLEKDLKKEQEPIPNAQPLPIGVQKPKKKNNGCLVAVIVFLVFTAIIGIAVSQNVGSSKKTDPAEQKKERIAFEDHSWKDFLTICDSHFNFLTLIDNYSNGKTADLDFYNACKEMESISAKNATIFNYANTDLEKKYLELFTKASLEDQEAAKSYKKYIDTKSMEDLSNAKNHTKLALDAFTEIAKTRYSILVGTGLSDAEAKKKIDQGTAEVNALNKK